MGVTDFAMEPDFFKVYPFSDRKLRAFNPRKVENDRNFLVEKLNGLLKFSSNGYLRVYRIKLCTKICEYVETTCSFWLMFTVTT